MPNPPADPVGAATLERLAAAPNFNRWMFERIGPWIGRRVLDIGSGIGNIAAFFADRDEVVLTDTDPAYRDRLRRRFHGRPQVEIAQLHLPHVAGQLAKRRFDTIVCLNVLEHIADDAGALAAMRGLLEAGGRLVLLVPALPALFGSLDRALGHVRRYTPAELKAKLGGARLAVRHVEFFNLAGIPGWWFTGRVLRRTMIPAGALRWYDALVPLFRLERLLPWRVGQSLIAIGEAA